MWTKAAILAAFLAFFLGMYIGRESVEPERFVKTYVSTNVQEHVKQHKIITTEIRKKNGDLIKRVEKDDQQTQETEKQSVKQEVHVVPVRQVKSKYALGLEWEPSITTPPNVKDTRIEGGARLGDSDFWLQGGYSIKNNQFSLGIRYEW